MSRVHAYSYSVIGHARALCLLTAAARAKAHAFHGIASGVRRPDGRRITHLTDRRPERVAYSGAVWLAWNFRLSKDLHMPTARLITLGLGSNRLSGIRIPAPRRMHELQRGCVVSRAWFVRRPTHADYLAFVRLLLRPMVGVRLLLPTRWPPRERPGSSASGGHRALPLWQRAESFVAL